VRRPPRTKFTLKWDIARFVKQRPWLAVAFTVIVITSLIINASQGPDPDKVRDIYYGGTNYLLVSDFVWWDARIVEVPSLKSYPLPEPDTFDKTTGYLMAGVAGPRNSIIALWQASGDLAIGQIASGSDGVVVNWFQDYKIEGPPGPPPWSIAIDPLGRTLALVDEDFNLELLDIATGSRRIVVKNKYVGEVAWSPDGATLAYTEESSYEIPGLAPNPLDGFEPGEDLIYTLDLQSGKSEPILEGSDPSFSSDGSRVLAWDWSGHWCETILGSHKVRPIHAPGTNLGRVGALLPGDYAIYSCDIPGALPYLDVGDYLSVSILNRRRIAIGKLGGAVNATLANIAAPNGHERTELWSFGQ